ncbi:hypothetical protein [Hyphomonas sp.]|uniref:hypothetical protein n=1 Tax=Hyphomonas sp. TaxID=87 RepID=UPI0035290D02
MTCPLTQQTDGFLLQAEAVKLSRCNHAFGHGTGTGRPGAHEAAFGDLFAGMRRPAENTAAGKERTVSGLSTFPGNCLP